MKNILKNKLLLISAFAGFGLFFSCNYQEIADADFPESELYLPVAVNGIYEINEVSQHLDFHPTPGQASRYYIDLANNKFVVPLAVYRSGLDRSGKLSAGISVNKDTISVLISESVISPTVIIPNEEFTCSSSVEIQDGDAYGTFDLDIELDYLKSLPDTTFGIGISISSADAEVNSVLNTAVILIDNKILE